MVIESLRCWAPDQFPSHIWVKGLRSIYSCLNLAESISLHVRPQPTSFHQVGKPSALVANQCRKPSVQRCRHHRTHAWRLCWPVEPICARWPLIQQECSSAFSQVLFLILLGCLDTILNRKNMVWYRFSHIWPDHEAGSSRLHDNKSTRRMIDHKIIYINLWKKRCTDYVMDSGSGRIPADFRYIHFGANTLGKVMNQWTPLPLF